MRTLRTVRELRSVLEPARRGTARGRSRSVVAAGNAVVDSTVDLAPTAGLAPTIGLVPTMGALHKGHLSLIRRAREQCDVVVVSLFVNPAQFDDGADLDGYPRQEERDGRLAAEAGADILFAPPPEEVYPAGFATSVEVLGLTDRLEGAVRGASHFRGVTTVVTKLLNMVQPQVAYFGQKDAQQVAVIRRLVADLDLPVRVEVCPTVREPDGLAMSSRNTRLNPGERVRAVALCRALEAADELAAAGERSGEALLAQARAAMRPFDIEPEYLALVDPATLEPAERLDAPALLVVAARVGSTRLIDNIVLEPSATATHSDTPLQSSVAHPSTGPARSSAAPGLSVDIPAAATA